MKRKSKPKKKIKKKKDPLLKHMEDLLEEAYDVIKHERSKFDKLPKSTKLTHKVLTHTKSLWLPIEYTKKKVESHSWFNINEFNPIGNHKNYNVPIETNIDEAITKCSKVKIYPTQKQRDILHRWLDSYTSMYNETIKFFKRTRYNKTNTTTSFRKIRTYHIKQIRDNLVVMSKHPRYTNNTKIPVHVMDYAIHDACASFKSCLTNLREGNIKHFRLRYLKQDKPSKIMRLEARMIRNNALSPRIFGNSFAIQSRTYTDENGVKHKLDWNNINQDFLVQYKSMTNEFHLLIPTTEQTNNEHDIKNSVAGDPGIRTFLTMYSNNKCTDLCSNLKTKLKPYLKQIDRIHNDNTATKKQIRKLENRCYTKIDNLINDMHWKVIKYLTDNYDRILIGNMSTKGIISNNNVFQLDKYNKRIASLMKLYVFRQRLEFKCQQRKLGYAKIDEAYTTKICTRCGMEIEGIYGKHVIKCPFCKLKIKRDFSGARNIFINSLEFH